MKVSKTQTELCAPKDRMLPARVGIARTYPVINTDFLWSCMDAMTKSAGLKRHLREAEGTNARRIQVVQVANYLTVPCRCIRLDSP